VRLEYDLKYMDEALAAGDGRQDYAEKVGLEHYGDGIPLDQQRANHKFATVAEYIVHLYLRVPWRANVGEVKAVDHEFLETRARRIGPGLPHPDLFIRPRDWEKRFLPYLLVWINEEESVAYLVGWLCGWEAWRRRGNWCEARGGWFVPPPYHSIRSLEQWIECGHPRHHHPPLEPVWQRP